MFEGGYQEPRGDLPLLAIFLLVQDDAIEKHGDDDDGHHGEAGVDTAHYVHLGFEERNLDKMHSTHFICN